MRDGIHLRFSAHLAMILALSGRIEDQENTIHMYNSILE